MTYNTPTQKWSINRFEIKIIELMVIQKHSYFNWNIIVFLFCSRTSCDVFTKKPKAQFCVEYGFLFLLKNINNCEDFDVYFEHTDPS